MAPVPLAGTPVSVPPLRPVYRITWVPFPITAHPPPLSKAPVPATVRLVAPGRACPSGWGRAEGALGGAFAPREASPGAAAASAGVAWAAVRYSFRAVTPVAPVRIVNCSLVVPPLQTVALALRVVSPAAVTNVTAPS